MMAWLALLAAVFWGTSPILEKRALGTVSPVAAVLLRSVTVAVVAMLYLIWEHGSRPMRSFGRWQDALLVMLAGFISAGVGQVLYFAALRGGKTSVVVPLAACYPLVTVVLSVLLLGERVRWWHVAGVVLILAGIMLISRHE